MMFNKIYITLVLALLLCNSIIANATTLSLYTWRAQEVKLWNEINKQNLLPGITIQAKVILYDNYRPYVLIELQNNKVDLFQWTPGASNLKELIDYNFIKQNSHDISEINKSALSASLGHDGHLYGVPFALQLQSILVNSKLVKKYGINNAPSSMAELDSVFSKLKSNGITPLHLAGGANWYVSQVLGEVLMAGLVEDSFANNLLKGEVCFTDPKFISIFTTLANWKKSGYLNNNASTENYGAMNNSIALGNSAMSFDGGWKTGATSEFYQVDSNYKFEFWPVPGASKKVYALGDGTYQVALNSQYRDKAIQVLEFTSTKKFAELFAEFVGELPAYGGSINIQPGVLKDMAAIVASQSYSVGLFTAYEINRGKPSYNQLLNESIKAVLASEKSPQQAAQHIQDGLNSWGYIGSTQCQ